MPGNNLPTHEPCDWGCEAVSQPDHGPPGRHPRVHEAAHDPLMSRFSVQTQQCAPCSGCLLPGAETSSMAAPQAGIHIFCGEAPEQAKPS